MYKSLAQLALLQRGIEQPTLDKFNPILDQKLQPQYVLIMLVRAHNKINLMNLIEVGEKFAVKSSFVHFFAQYKKLISSPAYDALLVGNQAPLGSWINIDHLKSFLNDLDLNLGPQMSMLLKFWWIFWGHFIRTNRVRYHYVNCEDAMWKRYPGPMGST